jgi:Inorganic pyrophosphatase/exopolyphosphatase
MSKEKTVYIFGHKNPDTDCGVAAAAYARLKQLQGHKNYIAARAGRFAPQTEYVFKKFNVPYPEYIPDLIPKVQYYMSDKCETVSNDQSVWQALAKLEASKANALPVVDKDGKYVSMLHYSTFAQNLLTIMNPEHKTAISTSVNLVMRTLNAQPIIVQDEDAIFKASVLIGGSSEEAFKKILDEHSSENEVVITSDRETIHKICIEGHVKLLVITSGFVLKKDLREQAKANGVSVLISPHTTAATAVLITYSTPVSLMSDKDIPAVHPMDTVSKIRPMIKASPCRCLPVVNDENKVLGTISEHDLLHEPNIEVILVDHNERTQAVDGVEHYKIQEVIDHHRLGMFSTNYPITFINKTVGATATLITRLYQEARVPIPKEIAGILLCAILSDTLILQSATTTDVDRRAAAYLSDITDLDIQQTGTEILTAGSRVEGRGVSEIIHQDMKEYKEEKATFTVSQIEVGDVNEILTRKADFLKELEKARTENKALFSALLITDITQLSSMLLIAYDPIFLPFITFPKKEENVYFLKDVVSRKKQLIPLITEQMETFER